MLKITANNKELDLGDLKGVTIKKSPGIFDNDSTDGSYTVPFSIEGNEINNLAFDFPYKMGNKNKQIREVQGQLWHSGILIGEGVIKASKFSYRKITCNFYIDNGNLYKDFNENMLNENDFGGYKPWVQKSEYNYALDDFVMYMVQNDNYFKGTIIEGNEGTYGKYQNYYASGNFVWNDDAPLIYTPFPLLWRTLNALFINKGFRYFDNFFSQGDYRTINIFNTVNAIEAEIYNVNGQDFTRNKLTRYNIANHLPHIPTGEFIKAIQNFFNVKFYVRDYKVQVIDRLQMIRSSSFDDLNSKTVGRYTKELTGLSFDGISYNILRDENDENLATLATIPEGYVHYTEINPGSDPMPIDPYPYAIVFFNDDVFGGYYQYLNERDRYDTINDFWYWWTVAGPFPYTPEERTYNEQEGIYLLNREFELNANLSGVPNYIVPENIPGYNYFKPKVLQKGNSFQHYSFNNFSLRLIMYEGLKTDVDGDVNSMPLGSISRGDISITAKWSYFERWNEYLEWWQEAQKEDYDQELQLSASEIKNFDFSRKKLINGNLFFITEMSIQLTRKEIKPAKCKMIKAQ